VHALLALPLLLLQGEQAEQPLEKKALLVFVDGFIPEAITKTRTRTLDGLLEHAAYSYAARAESTTISGSGWSSFLTGVHWDKHGVPDNAFKAPNYERYPHVFARLKEVRPDAFCASAQCWEPIEKGLVIPSGADKQSYHDYYAYSDDYFDADSSDTLCVDDLVGFLAEPQLDLAVMMFGELDGVGHSDANAHYHAGDPLYGKMLTKIDEELGRLMAAIRARKTYAQEDWLIIVSSDHGGARGSGHGKNIPAHRRMPLIVSGASVAPGEIWPPPQAVDIVPTVLHHLGVAVKSEWGIDGRVVGFAPSAPPIAALDVNLIFNGDGEYERGFRHYTDSPDASIAGWDDPGEMTLLVYGSEGPFPGKEDKLPPAGGMNYFAGGALAADSHISQTIDLTPLAKTIRAGADCELSAWLGGYLAEEDSASLSATFYDKSGQALDHYGVGPVTPAERGKAAGFEPRSVRGPVPKGTARVVVHLSAKASSGSNDGYADNLSLVLSARD